MSGQGFVQITSPLSRPLHFVLLELAVLACTLFVFLHAYREYKKGDRRHLFQWLVITAYGVMMELIAFNFLHNYEHSRFTIQLYHGQLPLYVTGLYGSFMYTGIKVAERLRVHPIAEAFLAGFATCLIDVPFDIAGVAVGWWRWLDTDPNLAFRWLGVPVTSYYWYLIFTPVAALQCRILWPRLERRSFSLAGVVAFFAGFGVIFFGVLGFLPFHGIKALGVSDGTIVAGHLFICGILALLIGGKREKLPPLVAAVVCLLPGGHLAFLLGMAASGNLVDAVARLLSSAAAFVGLVVLAWALPFRKASSGALVGASGDGQRPRVQFRTTVDESSPSSSANETVTGDSGGLASPAQSAPLPPR